MSQTDSYLTLCIEERGDDDYSTIKNRLFLSYDVDQETYVVYGKSHRNTDTEPYFFRANKSSDMYKFVKFIIGKESGNSYTLYNYNNMPFDLEGVDYDFMESNIDVGYQIAAYDDVKLSKREFRKNLRMLKNVYNFC